MKILIAGTGRALYFLAREFISKGHQVTLIVHDVEEARSLVHRLNRVVVVTGDGSRMETLEEAGARRMSAFIALLPDDEDNLIACQIARLEFGIERTLALVNDPENESVFSRLGVSSAVSPTRLLSLLIEEQASFREIETLLPLAGGRVTATEVKIPDASPVVGQSLSSICLPGNALVACIIREDEVIVPRGENRIASGDRLILISTPGAHGPALRLLTGENPK